MEPEQLRDELSRLVCKYIDGCEIQDRLLNEINENARAVAKGVLDEIAHCAIKIEPGDLASIRKIFIAYA